MKLNLLITLFFSIGMLISCKDKDQHEKEDVLTKAGEIRARTDSIMAEQKELEEYSAWESKMRKILIRTGYSFISAQKRIDSIGQSIHGTPAWLINHQKIMDSIIKANDKDLNF